MFQLVLTTNVLCATRNFKQIALVRDVIAKEGTAIMDRGKQMRNLEKQLLLCSDAQDIFLRIK